MHVRACVRVCSLNGANLGLIIASNYTCIEEGFSQKLGPLSRYQHHVERFFSPILAEWNTQPEWEHAPV